MTWRRLRVIIEGLPTESRTMTAIRNSIPEEERAEQADSADAERARWSQLEQLMAAAVDAVRHLEYTLTCINTEKKRQWPDPPKPLPRPGSTPPKKKAEPMTDVAAERLFQLINGGAA